MTHPRARLIDLLVSLPFDDEVDGRSDQCGRPADVGGEGDADDEGLGHVGGGFGRHGLLVRIPGVYSRLIARHHARVLTTRKEARHSEITRLLTEILLKHRPFIVHSQESHSVQEL